jgi:hypothetical protein
MRERFDMADHGLGARLVNMASTLSTVCRSQSRGRMIMGDDRARYRAATTLDMIARAIEQNMSTREPNSCAGASIIMSDKTSNNVSA